MTIKPFVLAIASIILAVLSYGFTHNKEKDSSSRTREPNALQEVGRVIVFNGTTITIVDSLVGTYPLTKNHHNLWEKYFGIRNDSVFYSLVISDEQRKITDVELYSLPMSAVDAQNSYVEATTGRDQKTSYLIKIMPISGKSIAFHVPGKTPEEASEMEIHFSNINTAKQAAAKLHIEWTLSDDYK